MANLIKCNLTNADFSLNAGCKESLDLTQYWYLTFEKHLTKWLS